MQEIQSMLEEHNVYGTEEPKELETPLFSHTHYIACNVIIYVSGILFTVALLIL